MVYKYMAREVKLVYIYDQITLHDKIAMIYY